MSRKNIEAIYPLSPMQQGILFHTIYAPGSGDYIIQLSCRCEGKLDVAAFKRAWAQVITRNSVLRTSFVWQRQGEPLQVVHRQVELVIDVHDWRGMEEAEQQKQLQMQLADDRRRGFDLQRAPLMSVQLAQTGEQSYWFVWSAHHLLMDGWSLPLLLKEVFSYYEAYSQGRELQLETSRPYEDYIGWLLDQDMAAAETYWRRRLAGFTEPTPLPAKRNTGDQPKASGYAERKRLLSTEVTDQLRRFSRQQQVTLNTVVQAVWALLLSRYSGAQDLVYGATVSGRPSELAGVEEMVGLFINTLPVRVKVTAEQQVGEWLRQLQSEQVEMRQYEYSPLVAVQGWSEVARGQALFESIVLFENYPVSDAVTGQNHGLRISDVRSTEQNHYPITIAIEPGARLGLMINYYQSEFDAEVIERLMTHLQRLLESLSEDPEQPIATVQMLSVAERHQLLVEWNDTESTYPADKSLAQLFEEQVERTPEATAVVYQEDQFTYAELNRRANQLAHHLRRLGAGPEQRVGICVERSAATVIGLLGVLKAGGAYVPLDPAYPGERLGYMLHDAGVELLVTQNQLRKRIPEHDAEAVCLDTDWSIISRESAENPARSIAPAARDNLAYVIYTSGSTGKPKGVMVSHRNVVNFFTAMDARIGDATPGAWLAVTSISFDISVLELLWTLARGFQVIVQSDRAVDFYQTETGSVDASQPDHAFAAQLVRHRVSHLQCTPSLAKMLLTEPETVRAMGSLRKLMVGGEAWPASLPEKLRQLVSGEIHNMYGPTETTIWSTTHLLNPAENTIPIGRPIGNTQIYVVDQHYEPTPVGVYGELLIGGAGVARGYLGRPELTAEKFIPSPFSRRTGERLYKTGDLARYRPDGAIEFLGRIDQQVKLRGYRIELEEIETILNEHPAVSEAIVTASEDEAHDQLLTAHIVANPDQALSINDLRSHLRQRLPEYMVPAAFGVLDVMPLTSNGKVDRRALSDSPATVIAQNGNPFAPPRTPTEELLAGVWRDLLRLDQVGTDDNFFELGGHSLLAIQMISRIRQLFKIELPVRRLFEAPTIGEMARNIDAAIGAGEGLLAPPIEKVGRDQPLPLSFAQQRLWFFNQLEPGNVAYNVPFVQRIMGPLDVTAIERALSELIRRHESLRTTFTIEEGQPVQIIALPQPLRVSFTDLSSLPEEERAAEAQRLATAEAGKPFDLEAGPLLRVKLLRLDEADHVLLMTMHQIIHDVWSMGVLIHEVGVLYSAFIAREPSPLPEMEIQYADYAVWQRKWLQGEALEQQLSYWTAQLAGAPPVLDLPTDHPRPPVQSYRGASLPVTLSHGLTEQLKHLSQMEGATLFMTLLTAFQVLLGRYAGQSDVVVGTPVANRTQAATENLIGFFLNTLALRTNLAGEPTLRGMLKRAREVCLGGYAHQEFPFEKLVEQLQPAREISYHPVFQVMLALPNTPHERLELPNLTLSPVEVEIGNAIFDLTLVLEESSEGLRGNLHYRTDLFESETVSRLAVHYQLLLKQMVTHPDELISRAEILTEAERHEILFAWNQTEHDYPRDACFYELFQAQVGRTPDAIAAACADQHLTYLELDQRVTVVAGRLLEFGLGPESIVPLLLERSLDLLVAILALFKVGAAYLPLDPLYPIRRIAQLLDDSQCQLLVSSRELSARLGPQLEAHQSEAALRVIAIEELSEPKQSDGLPARRSVAANLAYVIYTSGSSGRPKGVMIQHRSMINHLCAKIRDLELSSEDVVAQTASASFDISVWQYLAPLMVGGQVRIVGDEVARDAQRLLDEVRDSGVTVWETVPSLLSAVLGQPEERNGALGRLRWLLTTGEALSAELCVRWQQRYGQVRMVNAYGPTECSDDVLHEHVRRMESGERVAIGRPVINVRVYVLDEEMGLLPVGVSGEICIGGEGVGRGYLRDAAQTAERFVPDRYSRDPGARMYRTGDVGRLLNDGRIEYLGRADEQVKVRGHRIELGEVEAVLREHERVKDAVVVVRADGEDADKRLVAYLVPESSAPTPAESNEAGEWDEKVAGWRGIFDLVYSQGSYSSQDRALNLRVWINSYTNQPFSEAEVFECVDDTVSRILQLQPESVLEVGCGTGLLLHRIAPHCRRYYGTDLSAAVLRVLRQQIEESPEPLPPIILRQQAANDFREIPTQAFDLIIINEVVQYFPDIEYLVSVLEGAINCVKPGGAIFVGGVRNLSLLQAFHTSVQLDSADGALTVAEFEQRVQTQVAQEKELLIRPDFFSALQQVKPQISEVQFQLKGGQSQNELTKFRYDVVLRIGGEVEPEPQVEWIDWQQQGMTVDTLHETLRTTGPELLCLQNIPNARVLRDVTAVQLLGGVAEATNVADVRQALASQLEGMSGVDPAELWGMSAELAYTAGLAWTDGDPRGSYDAVLKRQEAGNGRSSGAPGRRVVVKAWSEYANRPAGERELENIVPQLRGYLKQRLPEYMVPAAFVTLRELPLTANGKVDRRALPAPESRLLAQRSYVAPRSSVEEMVAGIWSEVLHLERVSIHDNFFDLGGHSLLATQVISRVRQRFQVELPLRTMFEVPTVAQSAQSIAQALEAGAGLSAPPIGRVSREQPLPLSFAQQRLWFLDQLEPGSTVYNLPLALRVAGHLDEEALHWSLNELIRRHETLRTTFHSVQGEAIQVITPAAAVNLPLVDLSGLAEAEREAEAQQLILAESGHGFDLTQGPLLRTKLLRLSDEEHILLLTMHHIISDAWSMTVLVREAVTLYEAFRTGESSPLPELPVQYADYAVWQREWLQGAELEKQLSYWREQFRDGVPVLGLPTDKPRPAALGHHGAGLPFNVDDQLAEGLKALCKQQGVTLFMVLLAAWQTLLGRYSGQDELVVGADMANRNRAETEELIGFFVNMLVMRADLRGDPSFLALLEQVRASCLGAYAHQDLPFEKLVDELAPDRDLSHSPLFQVAFVLQNVPPPDQSIAGVRIKTVRVETKTTPFDLLLSMDEFGEHLDGLIIFNTDLFQTPTIEQLANQFKRLLAGIVLDPGQRIWSLPLFSEDERRQILSQSNQGARKYPSRQLLDQLFQLQAERAPQAVALVLGQEQVTYRELNRRANQLAHYLQARDVGPDVTVAMLMSPSVEMLVGIMGILKAGGAYLPLDPQYPSERLAFILEDAHVRLVLTEHHLRDQFPDHAVELLCLDSDWSSIAAHSQEQPANLTTPDHLAYVIYTSGSTGKPKGVLVTHTNVARLFSATHEWFNFNAADVWTLFHSYAFDFSVWEIWGALLYGGRLVIVSPLVSRSPEAFYELLVTENVTVLNQTPSAFRQLMRAEESWRGEEVSSLRLVIFGGEALETSSLRAWFERHGDEHPRLVNMYGITETTVHVTYHPITVAEIEEVGVSLIGRPIGDLELYVLDREMGPAPIGVYGEMYVGGAGLARNYLNRAELTAERFVPHPFSGGSGERLYRTGDLARYRRDGELEYGGRIDDQVKVRGFRIELGEVEATLRTHQAIRECVVVAREDMPGDKRLVAYVVAAQEFATTVSELRHFLLEKLPEYMAPAVYVMLPELPLTPNGKINRKLLPAPEQARPELTESFVAPRTRTERLLADVWSEILQVPQIGIYDNFFDLGGDSILSIKALAKAREHGLNFSVQQLFQHATVARLAQNLFDEQSIAREPTTPFSLISAADRQQLPEDVEDAYPLTMLQGGMIFHSEYSPETAVYHDIFCYELRAPFNLDAMRAAIQEMMRRHAALRTSFDLASYSEPLQLVHRKIEPLIEYADLSGLDEAGKQAALDGLIATEKERPFRWDQPPLLRVLLHRRSADVFQFALSFHHVLFDGWSLATLLNGIFLRYWYLLGRTKNDIGPAPKLTFREFVALERQAIESRECQQYWQDQLADCSITLLPRWSTVGPQTSEPAVRVRDLIVTPAVSDGLRNLARMAEAPLKSVLLGAHLRVLSLLTGQRDVTTGLACNGRPEESEGEQVIGLFLNPLPFRQELSGGTWEELVRKVFAAEQEMLAYRRYPLVELQRQQGGESLFEVEFNFSHFHVLKGALQLDGIELIRETTLEETNLTLLINSWVQPQTSQVKMELMYDAGQLTEDQISAIAGYYCRLLEAMASEPLARYEAVSLLSEQEMGQLLVEWNQTRRDYPRNSCIQQLFEVQAERLPDSIAVIFQDQQVTYSELNRRSNQLAHYLQQLGVGPEIPVAICMERSLEMIVSLLAVLKAGGAYLALDPSYPEARLSFMLADAGAPLLLTQHHLAATLSRHDARVIAVDGDLPIITEQPQTNLHNQATADNLAYITYTSGSTGTPKGVCIPHRAVARLTQAVDYVNLSSEQKFLQLAPLSFDASTFEIWGSLLNGALLIVMPPEQPTVAQLGKAIEQYQVTTLWLTAGLFHLMVDEQVESLRGVKQLLAGGDVLSVAHVERLRREAAGCQLINGYGPTENTTFTTTHRVDQGENLNSSVPIGRPIANSRVYVLDEEMSAVVVGVVGELYAGGDGLARGYLKRAELTAERFVPDGLSTEPGARLYRTGDMVRYRADGVIEYVGRVDNQVKVRGYRVEVDEIAVVLGAHDGVDDAVVIVKEDEPGDRRLVAYLVSEQTVPPSIPELRSYLKEKVPEYMIPSAFMWIAKIPLTPNGKIDRRALPAPEFSDESRRDAYVAPRTPIEEMIRGIWSEVLRVEQVSVHDDFFELGGHSLLATQAVSRMRNVLRKDLPLRTLFEHPTVAGMAATIQTSPDQPEIQSITRHELPGPYPLSFAQQRLWFLDELLPSNPFYNINNALRFTHSLDLSAFERALNEIVRRHEALRTTFKVIEGRPVQVVAPHLELMLPVLDLGTLPEAERDREALRVAREEAERPFDLAQGPLIRTRLVRLDENDYLFLLTIHHIVSDGWSMNVFSRELNTLYAAFSSNQPSPLPELPIQYADFAVWQREWLQGEVLEAHLEYWDQQLAGLSVLQLPTDRPRPVVPTARGAFQPIQLPASMKASLKALSQREGVTLFMTLLAAFQTLLHRYTAQDDIAVGSPIANRNRAEIEGLIGFFVNSLVMRTDFSRGPSFRELLGRVREMALGAYAHEDLPFEKLVEELHPERDMSRNPLFQVDFQLFNPPQIVEEAMPDAGMHRLEVDSGTSIFDLTLSLTEGRQGLSGGFEYSTDLFDAATIKRMGDHFHRLLEGIVDHPEQRASLLPLLTKAEEGQALYEWNETRTAYPGECFHQLFEQQVERTPAALALTFEGEELTYRELNQRANQLAHYLRSQGVGPDVLVPICMERSPELMIGLLGILKAGGAYLPLDPAQPKQRLAFILEEAQTPMLLTQQHLRERLPVTDQTIYLDASWETLSDESAANPVSNLEPENLAYVIYTSGSTGKPKGVMITHRGLVNYLSWCTRAYLGREGRGAPVFSSLVYDLTVTGVFAPLLTGQAVMLMREEEGIKALDNALSSGGDYSLVKLTPAHLEMLSEQLDAGEGKGQQELMKLTAGLVKEWSRALIIGGEALRWEQLAFWQTHAPDTRLINEYGPTETVVGCCVHEVAAGAKQSGAVPIGHPIANTQIYILDRDLQPVPIGVTGELYIGGDGVGRGYLNRPDLTAERFIGDPFAREPGARMYRSGDLARYSVNGEIVYHGRIDDQVKVRGYRVEPGEIETVLAQHPVVQEAVVLAREDIAGDKRLVAYVVPDSRAQDQEAHLIDVQWNAEQVSRWQQVFDEMFAEKPALPDSSLNLAGWDSSYTGLPIPVVEMQEQVDRTVERILAPRPNRVLEIGCGTGLLLLRIAPHCAHYCGTDFSAAALEYVREQTAKMALPEVRLLQRSADDFEGIEEKSFDTVIINSVAQYFPGVEYLASVLENAVKSVAPGGSVFVGDVRSLPLLEVFHASVELYKAPATQPTSELLDRIERRVSQEEELVIDPAFFTALQRRLPQINNVEIQIKRGHHHNEMSCFRYDVRLNVGEQDGSGVAIAWLDWEGISDLANLRQIIKEQEPAALGIRDVPSARLRADVKMLELLRSADGPQTVEGIREAVAMEADTGMEPEDFWAIEQELPYDVRIGWSGAQAPGCFDVILQRRGAAVASGNGFLQAGDQPWSDYVNDTLGAKFAHKLVPVLRSHLNQQLPDYMIPSNFVMLKALPLTPHGKVDRHALPAPYGARPVLERAFVAPRNRIEEILAETWAKVLGLEQVGIHDNFFELGGHSLLATQVVARLRDAFQVELPLRIVFECPTIAELAETIRGAGAELPAIVPVSREARSVKRTNLAGRPTPFEIAE